MARQNVTVGGNGPYLYDDSKHYAIETPGVIKSDLELQVGTTDKKIVMSNATKELVEIATLADWVNGKNGINTSDDGVGGVDVSTDSTVPQVGDNETVNGQWTFSDKVTLNKSLSGGEVLVDLPVHRNYEIKREAGTAGTPSTANLVFNSTVSANAWEFAHNDTTVFVLGGGDPTALMGKNVGVHTLTPGYPLEVDGAAGITSYIDLEEFAQHSDVSDPSAGDVRLYALGGDLYKRASDGTQSAL